MFYDLHLPWKPNVAETPYIITFLHELGYDVIALSHTLAGKLPADLTCPIPAELPFKVPQKVQILRRCTLILSDPSQNHRLPLLASSYDILALRPTNEKSLQQACQSLECDLISIDLTLRYDFHFRMKMLAPAIERGIKFEICYGSGINSTDSNARRNMISNATQLIRATRGRGLIISSEASKAAGCRSPWDLINLAAVWGLGQERGKEALSKLARSVVVSAQMKRTGYRGVIDVVYGGEKPPVTQDGSQKGQIGQKKRKADTLDDPTAGPVEKQLIVSKRAQKKQKKASLELEQKTTEKV